MHITAWSDTWPARFAAEHARIIGALQLSADDLQHIGSTAVPGMVAKPIVDLMLGRAPFPPPSPLVAKLIDLGYEALGEAGVPGRLYLRRRGAIETNLHLVAKGGSHSHRNLALRDYLRADAAACARYEQAKCDAIAAGAGSLLDYSAAKAKVLGELVSEALTRCPRR